MKKFFFFAAAAVVAIASCTNVDLIETPANRINFQVANYSAQTRAAEDPTIALQDETTFFYSKAWLHANGALTGTDFFGTSASVGGNAWTETVNYTAGTPVVWEPTLEYFWPKSSDSYINFVSWFANNSKFPTVTETTIDWGTSSAPITVAATDTLLFADEAWRFKDNVNPATYNTPSGVAEGVPTLFHHALARLAFKLRLATPTSKATSKTIWDVTVKTVTLQIMDKGYIALTNTDPGTTATTAAWKVSSTPATSAIVGWTGDTANLLTISQASDATPTATAFGKLAFENFKPTTGTTVVDSKYVSGDFQDFLLERTVLPQTLGSTVQFGMTFEIKLFHADASGDKDGNAYSTEDVTVTTTNLTSLVSAITAWNMNTKVTYNITIDPVAKSVKFDPAVCEWATVNNGANGTQVYPAL